MANNDNLFPEGVVSINNAFPLFFIFDSNVISRDFIWTMTRDYLGLFRRIDFLRTVRTVSQWPTLESDELALFNIYRYFYRPAVIDSTTYTTDRAGWINRLSLKFPPHASCFLYFAETEISSLNIQSRFLNNRVKKKKKLVNFNIFKNKQAKIRTII